jgi:hypothetical protein
MASTLGWPDNCRLSPQTWTCWCWTSRLPPPSRRGWWWATSGRLSLRCGGARHRLRPVTYHEVAAAFQAFFPGLRPSF